MHPKNLPPVLVPSEYHAELERLTKATLMDLLWQFSADVTTHDQPSKDEDIINEIRQRAAWTVTYREQQ